MPIVEMPNGDLVDFADGTPDDEIRSLILKKFPELGSSPAAEVASNDAGLISDIGTAATKGAVAFNQSLIGVGNLLTSGRAGKAIKDAGYDAEARQKQLDAQYSEETQAANQAVRKADGFVDTVGAAVSNPRAVGAAVIESIPQMVGGAGVARGLIGATGKALAPIYAGAAGEGVMAAGSAAESIREGSDNGILTGKQSLAALASGIGTGAFGALGGKIAGSKVGQKLGLADIDTILAQGGPNALLAGQAKQGFIKSVIGSGISEGVLEELPQSMQEQMWQNYALDKPITEGVGNAAAMGMLAGAAMGGVGGGYNALATKPAPKPAVQPEEILAATSTDEAISKFVESVAADNIPADELLAGLDESAIPAPSAAPSINIPQGAQNGPAIPAQSSVVDTGSAASPSDNAQGGGGNGIIRPAAATESSGRTGMPGAAIQSDATGGAVADGSVQPGDVESAKAATPQTQPEGAAAVNPPIQAQQPAQSAEIPQKVELPATTSATTSQPVFGTNTAGKITLRGVPMEQIKAVRDKLGLKGTIIGKDSAVFPKGADLKTLQAAFNVEPAVAAPKQKKPQRASTDLLQRIKQLGGVDAGQALDITGEARAPGGWKFAFRKGGAGLDDLATQLAADGFQIDTSDVDGGVQQLRDMIRSHINGNRNFKAAQQEDAAQTEADSAYAGDLIKRAQELGINWKSLSQQQLDDAIYEAEDAIRMDALAEREAISDEGMAAAAELADMIDDGIDVPFGDEVRTDDAALAAFLGEQNGENDKASGGSAEKTAGEGAQEGVERGARTEPESQNVLESYTNAEVLKREAAAKKAEEDAAKEASAKSVTVDQADMFATQGALFNSNRQPAERETSSEQAGNVKASDDPAKWEFKTAEWKKTGAEKVSKVSSINSADIYLERFDKSQQPYGIGQATAVDGSGNVVGTAFYDRRDDGRLEASVEVAPGYRRKGIASAMYDAIESAEKEKLAPNPGHSNDAAAFWASREKNQSATKKLEVLKAQAAGKISGDQGAALKELADAGEHAAVDEVLKPAVPEQANTEDSGIYTLASHADMENRVREGTMSADEFKASFEALLKNKAGIIAELEKFTKPEIFKRFPGVEYRYKNEKKADGIEAVYREMVGDFTLGEAYSYGMSSGSRVDSIRAIVNKATDETLAEFADGLKKSKAEREAARAEALAGMDNPTTLKDFNRLMRAKAADMGEGVTFQQVRMTLPQDQRAKFDELAAEKSRAERASRKVAQQEQSIRAPGEAVETTEIIKTKHTKHGHDLWQFQMVQRVAPEEFKSLVSQAKRLGGDYSSYRGNGAIPGWQFRTEEAAKAFKALVAGDTEQAKGVMDARRDAYADDRSQSAVERLTEMADALDEKADASLNQDRKSNTARRARFAASAEASANAGKAMAQTMRNIAAGIENGTAKMLDRVRQKVQVEMLQGFVRTAFQEQFQKYADQEKAQPSIETADYAKYPSYTVYRSDLAGLGRALLEVEGTMKLGQRLMKVADDVSDAYLKFAKDNLLKVSAFSTKDGARAAFPNKASAEASIARSGYKGAAIVLPVKRNENLIILSPSEAIKRGIWEGDNDKRISLSADFGEELVEKIGKAARRGAKVSVPWQFENAYNSRKRLAGMNIETPAELRAALREFIGLRETAKQPDKIKQMERAMIGRKNDGFDFFPTPSAAADDAIAAADIKEGMTVYEPQAGMGHIADRIREAGVEPDVGEIASDRRELLEAKGYNIVSQDFMDMRLEDTPNGEGYDRIIMNPPFSDRRDAMHVQHAYGLLKPGGRLVSIMGEGVFFGQDKKAEGFREWLDSVGGTEEKLEQGTFMDPSLPVNTGVSARMVVIDKDSAKFSRAKPQAKLYSNLARQIEAAPDKVFSTGKSAALWLQANTAKLGIKKDELQWSGVIDWMRTQGKVTKADVLAYLDGNGVQVQEVMLGDGNARNRYLAKPFGELTGDQQKRVPGYDYAEDGSLVIMAGEEPLYLSSESDQESAIDDFLEVMGESENIPEGDGKFASYQLPGGENYRELLLTLPERDGQMSRGEVIEDGADAEFPFAIMVDGKEENRSKSREAADGILQGELERIDKKKARNENFRSSHYDHPNILAHIRFNERTDASGARVLFIEEIQSDWGQSGKKQGFKESAKDSAEAARNWHDMSSDVWNSASDSERSELIREYREQGIKTGDAGVPSAPFVTDTKSWTALALKRMIAYAADNGFDSIAWTTGEQQADRYSLAKQIDSLVYGSDNSLVAYDKSGNQVMGKTVPEADLEDHIGKEVAKKLIETKPNSDGEKILNNTDLMVGGEGMKGFYDGIVPQVASDILKKMGGKVESVTLPGKERDAGNGWGSTDEDVTGRPAMRQPGFTITDAMRAKLQTEGLPMFSAGKSGRGLPISEVESIANPIAEKLKNIRTVKVVARQNEIPGLKEQIDAAYSRYQRSQTPENLDAYLAVAKDDIEGAYVNGELYLVASNLSSAERVTEVLRHEVAHLSVKQMLEEVKPDLYQSFVNNVKMLDKAGNKYIRELAFAVDRTQPGLDANRRAEEIIAQIAERGDHETDMPGAVRTLWQKLIDGIKAFHKLVFGDKMTDQDARDIVAQSFRWARGEGDVARVIGGVESSGALASRGKQTNESFARMAIEELAADNDSLFAYKKSSSKSLTGLMADVVKGSEYLGDLTREDERAESGADHRYAFQTKNEYLFYVYEKDTGEVWIDVSRLETGGGGGAIYAAMGNYAYNAGKRFIGDPFGLSSEAVIRRTHHMLSSAIRFGTTKHLGAARQQEWGMPEDGVEPLDWSGSDIDKVEAMVHTIVETTENLYPSIKGYRYDYQRGEFTDKQGAVVDGATIAKSANLSQTTRPEALEESDGERIGIGEKTARRVVLLRSLLDADRADSSGGRNGILERVLRWDNTSMPESLRRLFSRRADGNDDTGDRASGAQQAGDRELDTGAGNSASWDSPEASKLDDIIYTLQDKHIDMKRVVGAIKDVGGKLLEKFNPYLAEELFHGRAAKRTHDFVNTELKPLLADMRLRGLSVDDLDQYLHARHAKEANALIAERDPDMPDGGSGMTNAEADEYMESLGDKRKRLEAAADKVDAIITKTRDLYVSYGLVSKSQADSWAEMFEHYVPLMREDHDGGMGLGQGFSIKGKEVKHRTGSTAKVVDILANIALQREKAITRGEKNRVAVALAGLVKLNPNPDFWTFEKPPTERVLNEKTGLVEERIDPMFKSRLNVVVAKIKDGSGEVHERAVIFNEDNERAIRMVESFKNLDHIQLGGVMGVSAIITRYFASVNTQYNPVFGIVNITRDVQGMALNLSSTPLAKHRADVLKLIPSAVKGIYLDSRAERQGHAANSKWARLWEELQDEGGMTGYRDLYRNSEDRANEIKRELDPTRWQNSALGKVFTANGALKVPLSLAQKNAGWLFDWLSDYNQTLEGATRLAAYKVAVDNGMTKQQAASLAKNITVNFNRKGQIGQQAGAMYAFFNAAMQGTARIAQTMLTYQDGKVGLTKAGKAIVYGGMTIGALQAITLAAAGFDDDEPPEFVRERALIIPIGGKKYVTIPMPLGFHVFPNLGRVPTEWALDGFRDTGRRMTDLVGIFIEAFNPIGSAGMSLQTLMPTAIDPAMALAENRDWTGKPIYKEDFNSMKPTPGFERNKDTATAWSKGIAEALNYLSGGTEYTPGAVSPTADQLDYLIGQVTGGVGREIGKLAQTGEAAVTGEALAPHKVPLLGRFYGNAENQSSQGNAYYSNIKRINEVEAEIKGRLEDRLPVNEYKAENPEWKLITRAKFADNIIRKLKKQKRELIERGAGREKIRAIEDRITNEMRKLNEAVAAMEEREAA